MMKGVNDQPEHARGLALLMRKLDANVQRVNTAKVNLIPFNPFPGTRFERSDEADIRTFQTVLLEAGVMTMFARTPRHGLDDAVGTIHYHVLELHSRQADGHV